MNNSNTAQPVKLVLNRVIKAPIAKVYQAWTDPAILAQWFSPNERWQKPEIDFEAREGSHFIMKMIHSDGDVFTMSGTVNEVVPERKISMSWTMLAPGSEQEQDSVLTIEFEPADGGTMLTLTHDRLTSAEDRDGKKEGWSGFLNMLELCIDGKPQWA